VLYLKLKDVTSAVAKTAKRGRDANGRKINASARRAVPIQKKKKTTQSSSSDPQALPSLVKAIVKEPRPKRSRSRPESTSAQVEVETETEARVVPPPEEEDYSTLDTSQISVDVAARYNEAFEVGEGDEDDRDDRSAQRHEEGVCHLSPPHLDAQHEEEHGRPLSPPAHEEAHEEEEERRDIPLGDDGNWMPGGPRKKELLPWYPHHIAALVWEDTEFLATGNNVKSPNVLIPRTTGKAYVSLDKICFNHSKMRKN